MEQRTPEWYLARRGKITASECYLLLANHKEAMTEEELAAYKEANPKSRVTTKEVPFSEGTFTYLKAKVSEKMMSEGAFLEDSAAKQIGNRATDWGTTFEAEARQLFAQAIGKDVLETGFDLAANYEEIFGGSPDGIVYDGLNREAIVEIKCPWNSDKHLDYFLFESAEDLKEYNLQYYMQIQANMLIEQVDTGYFVSYDPRMEKHFKLKVLKIPADKEVQDTLIERVELAEKWIAEREQELHKALAMV